MTAVIQTAYELRHPAAKLGMLGDVRTSVTEGYTAEDELLFGMACVAGTDPVLQVKKPSTGGEVFRGVTIMNQAKEQILESGELFKSSGKYLENQQVPVLRRGVIWVEVNQDVEPDDPAFFVHTGAAADIGKFRMDDAATDADAVPTGVFRSAATAGNLALLEINLP